MTYSTSGRALRISCARKFDASSIELLRDGVLVMQGELQDNPANACHPVATSTAGSGYMRRTGTWFAFGLHSGMSVPLMLLVT